MLTKLTTSYTRPGLVLLGLTVLLSAAVVHTQGQRTFDIYSIDVEGGQSTLFVSPSGETLLIDAGNPGDRDADRIAAVAREAGVTQIDYLLVTHYDGDHVGGVKDLSSRLPIRTFVDHGARVPPPGAPALTAEAQANIDRVDRAYQDARTKGRHIEVNAGDVVPIRGLDVRVVSSKGKVLTRPLSARAAANPLCGQFVQHPLDASENIYSVGVVIGAFDRFRMLDLGDLTWNTEHDLVCPNNLLGNVDVYLTTHHGLARSGPPALVHATRPRVVLMNNGPQKGNSRETWNTLKESPGLEDIWQLHYSVQRPAAVRFEEQAGPGGPEANAPDAFIANLGDVQPTHTPVFALKVSVRSDGGFTVTNRRTGFSKDYAAKSNR